ncbi:hypothetical protein [Selenomonas ruminantium]|uniref:hypothetical protein n=1 Tax=Selenomonas ruminantium TaxID=971 RepID=UPI00116154D0|nr:hypothetical protein [Selenomonas ruminantium]
MVSLVADCIAVEGYKGKQGGRLVWLMDCLNTIAIQMNESDEKAAVESMTGIMGSLSDREDFALPLRFIGHRLNDIAVTM